MKKLVSLLLALAMLLSCTAALADIGTPDAPVKVTMLLKDMPADDPAGQAFCKALNEKMAEQGMYVEFSFVDAPAGKYVEVMPLAVINEVLKADILYFQGNTDSTAAEQGFLEDMRPYVEGSQYLKNIMYAHNTARLENHPYLLAAAPIAVFSPVIRKDWVAQLDSYETLMADPTVDNYLAFFKELKDKGLCEYPICVYGDHSRLDSVFGAAFGVTTTLVKTEDGKWVYKYVTDEMKNLLAFYAQLYADGMIDPEYLTNTWDVAEEKFYSGKAAMLIGKTGATINVYDNSMQATNGADAALTVLPPAKSELGQYCAAVDVSKEERGRVISADSEVKEAAFAIFDFMASPEGRVLDLYGVEGFHYNIVDNKIVPIEGAPDWYGAFYDSLIGLENIPYEADAPMGEAGLTSLDIASQYFLADNAVTLPSEYSAYWDAMISLFNEYAVDVIRGDKNTDSDWTAFVEAWNAAGADKISEYLGTVME